ncbi:GDSL-type esterase/lipase family protein [Streptomyces sp. NBC_00091]|uniref:GDSL-type esterase/lipase family protein n=1 Tax=Streptomyces sp. NBC_00091 TaxID=2975648 RepID=UPI0022504937|nr:GDSL-type esterase/lipase family protein [Streptomyces sp. NBC_00091]MCX5376805.1 GDSL-type esterase/lipase family protein [Streptomyces sp. NBC_00091]
MRFMFVGDSMTIGRAGDYTWRYRMWQHLSATLGGSFEIVGPRSALYDTGDDTATSQAYAAPDFPAHARRHLAGWGEGWQHMAPLIGPAAGAARADVLLVSLGLIDLGFYTKADETAANVRRFVAAVREARPAVRMVFLPVIPNVRAEEDEPFASEVARFNELLAKAVADLTTDASPILLAARPEAYEIHHDTYDGTHPNASGEHRLAGEFAAVLHQAWGIGGPYRPAPHTPSNTP